MTGTARTIRISPADLANKRAYVRYGPEARIKLCHRAGAPWSNKDPDAKLSKLQKEVLTRPERLQIIHGASRLGKSVLGGCKLIIASMAPGATIACIAGTYNHVSKEWKYLDQGMRKLFAKHPQAFIRLMFRHSQNYHDYDCSTIWDSNARGYSTEQDQGAQLLGSEFTDAILGEGSYVSHDIFERKLLRAVDGAMMSNAHGYSRETGSISIFTTPKEYEGCSAAEWDRVMNSTKRRPERLHYDHVGWAQSVWIREANILENPAYPRAVFEARKAALGENSVAWQEQYLGKMTFKSGRVYTEFDDEINVLKPRAPEQIREMRIGIGFDTGAMFGAFLFGVDKIGLGYQLGEVYTQKRNITDSCAEVKEMVTAVLAPVLETDDWPTIIARFDLYTVDPASQHKIEIIDALDLPTISTPTRSQGKFETLPTIDIVRAYFSMDLLFLNEDCTWTLDQIKKYTWKQTKTAGAKAPVIREPRKDYDHMMDAMRFIVVPLMEDGPLIELPVAATPAEWWERSVKDQLFGPVKQAMADGELDWKIRTEGL